MADPARPVAQAAELTARFVEAAKPRSAWRIGVEHEKIGVLAESGAPVPYEGSRGIEALLLALCERAGFAPIHEGARVIALARGALRVTIEPGGQLELSGAPHAGLAEVRAELEGHLAELRPLSDELGLAWIAAGLRPFGTIDNIPWVPKGRYGIMRAYLPTRGRLAHHMMKRTATVQTNVDFADEDDAARKLRAAMSVMPIVTALFANSPIVDGKDSGFASYRAACWLETDPDRCGLLSFVFDDEGRAGSLFARYVEWALDVPMFFVYRGGYHPADGMTFRRFLTEGFRGERATLADWDTHLSTLFPEVRLKGYLELRGADSGSLALVVALAALSKGLLYDDEALRATDALLAELTFDERLELRRLVPRTGLATPLPRRRTVLEAARELVAIARGGLGRLAPEELPTLAPLEEIAESGRAPAERLRELWAAHGGDPARLIPALAY